MPVSAFVQAPWGQARLEQQQLAGARCILGQPAHGGASPAVTEGFMHKYTYGLYELGGVVLGVHAEVSPGVEHCRRT